MNHVKQILNYLQQGKPITKLEALKMFGCWNSGDVIFKLRNRGHKIVTDMVEESGKRFARYRLIKEVR